MNRLKNKCPMYKKKLCIRKCNWEMYHVVGIVVYLEKLEKLIQHSNL